MKLRKTKKGFTIVELVIVIAVIAILAAILIPTFASLTQKANVASDQSLKANLNTALRMQEAEDGEKNATMHDAVLDLDKQGFNLERITTKSNLFLLWDEDDNQFVLEDGQTANHKLWKIVNTPEEAAAEQNFSVYARQGDAWAGQTVTPHNGFDAGYNANISKVNYTNTPTNPQSGKEVVIRTNGGTLTINAASDTVNHYGEGLVLDIQAIAGSSYHEYGHFPKAEIKQGRIVVEDKGQVEILNVTGSGVVLDQVGSGSVELCYASSSENIPTGTAQVEPTVADIEIDDIVARTSFGVFTSLQNALDDFQAQGQKLFVVADITETMDANSGLCLYSKTCDFEIDGQGHIINASFVVNNTTTKIFFSNEEGKGIIRNTTINSTGIKYVFDVSTNGELLL